MGTRPLPFREQPKDPVVERRVANLEKRSLTQAAIDTSDIVTGGGGEFPWGLRDSEIAVGVSTPKPIFVSSSLAAFYAIVAGTTTGATEFELRHNGAAMPLGSLILPAGTDVDGIIYPAEGFAVGDDYEIAVLSVDAAADAISTWSVFES